MIGIMVRCLEFWMHLVLLTVPHPWAGLVTQPDSTSWKVIISPSWQNVIKWMYIYYHFMAASLCSNMNVCTQRKTRNIRNASYRRCQTEGSYYVLYKGGDLVVQLTWVELEVLPTVPTIAPRWKCNPWSTPSGTFTHSVDMRTVHNWCAQSSSPGILTTAPFMLFHHEQNSSGSRHYLA